MTCPQSCGRMPHRSRGAACPYLTVDLLVPSSRCTTYGSPAGPCRSQYTAVIFQLFNAKGKKKKKIRMVVIPIACKIARDWRIEVDC